MGKVKSPILINMYLCIDNRGREKGFFLIFALWFFLALSLFCLGLGFRTLIATQRTKMFLNKTRAFYLAVSGIKLARKVLQEDKDRKTDHRQEDWAKLIEEKVLFTSPRKEARFSVMIEDESARLNINYTNAPTLKTFFEEKGIEAPQEKADCILDYMDINPFSRSPEAFDCEDVKQVKNEEFSTPEELLLVSNFTKEDYKRVENFITVFGDRKINLNTVSEDLLTVLVEGEDLRDKILEVRLGTNDLPGDEDDGYFGGEEGETMPPGLSHLFTTNSQVFRIISEGNSSGIKKKIICIVRRDLDKILYWYEE